jgi:hypothetical protein
MPGDCPPLIVVMGYLGIAVGAFAGIFYLFVWLTICDPCNRSPFEFVNLLLGFTIILVFSIYMVAKMLFPVRLGPLLIPH